MNQIELAAQKAREKKHRITHSGEHLAMVHAVQFGYLLAEEFVEFWKWHDELLMKTGIEWGQTHRPQECSRRVPMVVTIQESELTQTVVPYYGPGCELSDHHYRVTTYSKELRFSREDIFDGQPSQEALKVHRSMFKDYYWKRRGEKTKPTFPLVCFEG